MTYDPNASIESNTVHFSMHGPERPLAVEIEASVLQDYFGASADPETWISAYEANFRVIHAVAQLKSEEDGDQFTLSNQDFSEASIKQLRAEHGDPPISGAF